MDAGKIATFKWAVWLVRRRRGVWDISALGISLVLVQLFVAKVPPLAALCGLLLAAFIPLPSAAREAGPIRAWFLGLPRMLGVAALTGAVLVYALGASARCLWWAALWPAISLMSALDLRPVMAVGRRVYGAGCGLYDSLPGKPIIGEVLRCSLLAAGSLWLMRGFARPTVNGTDDARWYGIMLADMVTQVRSGVFPVWLGQSVYQFNGAIYPLRVAPAFHYLGALLDALTFHKLGVFALQNLLVIVLGFLATATAYAGVRRLLPKRGWIAAGLAALFISCPGVLGISYNTDLYMSWTTVPLIPIIWFTTVRSFHNRGGYGTLVALGLALGLSWWGHSPIALWSTILAGAAQLLRIGFQWREGIRWRPMIAGAFVFAAVCAYPVGSVLLYPTEAGRHSDAFQRAIPETIVSFLEKAFPGTVLPLSPFGRSLGDFQLGYGLWAVLLYAIWSQRNARRRDCEVLLGVAILLTFLLLPIPGTDVGLWSAVPAFVRNTTGNWVMNRLYLPLACATVFAAAACVRAGFMDGLARRRTFAVILAVGCLWSLTEAGKFAVGSRVLARPAASAVDMLRPENLQLTQYSYLVFPKVPATFTHGVADPEMENGLLAKDTFSLLRTNADAALAAGRLVASGDFRRNDGSPLDLIDLDRTFRLEEGHSYLLKFDFAQPESISGVLQLTGPHLFREYALPEYGGARAFGAGGTHSSVLSVLSTSGPEDLSLQFVPSVPFPADQPTPAVAHVSQIEYEKGALPVRVDGWIPYRARVEAPADAWLQTPRMFQLGYFARVNGEPARVVKSPEGFVCIAVPAGASSVVLAYAAPAGLQFLFWLSTVSAVAAGAAIVASRLPWLRRSKGSA